MRYLLFIGFITSTLVLSAKDLRMLRAFEDSLSNYIDTILLGKISKNQSEAVIMSKELILDILDQDPTYPFDSVKNLSVLGNEQQTFRLFSWHQPLENGEHHYFAFVQYQDPQSKQFKCIELTDNSDSIYNPEYVQLTPKTWFGAIYYKLLEVIMQDRTYYTLLGWDGNNNFSRKKIIEVFYVDDFGYLRLGAPIFETEKKEFKKRVIFEYSSDVSMYLHFDTDYQMIVFDHLSPINPSYTGVYEYYSPDLSFDGYKAGSSYWELQTAVDVRLNKDIHDLDYHNPEGKETDINLIQGITPRESTKE